MSIEKSEFLEEIKKEISKHNLIIVEGKKDVNSLVYVGFNKKNIFMLNNGISFLENIESINDLTEKNNSKISILTDIDKKGKLLYDKIKRDLSQKHRIDNHLRELLIKEKISHVEGLSGYLSLD